MNPMRRLSPAWILAFTTLDLTTVWGATPRQTEGNLGPPDSAAAQGGEVLARGPVHEAFAETIRFDPEPGFLAPFAPRDTIDEVPPDVRPEGDNVEWIPGYYAWDDERSDFIWISGVWRAVPPGREWVPGYWMPAEQGFQWISGYWGDCDSEVAEYLPEPPASIELGPNLPAPEPDYTWIPGCWLWQTTHFAWRPGYFAPPQPNWLWVPDHYVYSPRGYVFVSGYWDCPIEHRGVAFAPMYFAPLGASWSHRRFFPSIAINTHLFLDHLFVRPHWNHYYFGDYYGEHDYNAGFVAAFHYGKDFGGFDPFYAFERQRNRHDGDWEHRIDLAIHDRREHADRRPSRRFGDRTDHGGQDDRVASRSESLVMPIADLPGERGLPRRLREVDPDERKVLAERERAVRGARDERADAETSPRNPPEPSGAGNRSTPAPQTRGDVRDLPPPERIKRAQSPVVSKTVRDPGLRSKVPNRTPAPNVDPKIEPRQRKPSAKPGERNPNPGRPNPGKPTPRKPNDP